MIGAKELQSVAIDLNILYVEDEAILRDSLKSTLSKLFKNTFVATNLQEAFEIFKKEDIDIILTDINMPVMNGTELIQSIQKYTDQEPLIVVLSAHNESKLLTNLINLEISYFINKPLDKQLMIKLLYKACSTINDKKLLLAYEEDLQNELEAMRRKNIILEQKLKQLALQTNKNINNKRAAVVTPQSKKIDANYHEALLQEDIDELSDLSSEIENYLAMMFQGEKLNEDYLYKLSDVYLKYASVLNSYPEFFDIGAFLHAFAQTILETEETFMRDINQTGIYLESMQLTLESFRKNVILKEAKDPKFYNASLINDIQVVVDYLQAKEADENDCSSHKITKTQSDDLLTCDSYYLNEHTLF